MVVAFTITYAISAHHHQSCDFESWSWWGVLDTTLCDKVCQRLATGWWFSSGITVSSTNKTDRQDITEILLKVALNTIPPPEFWGDEWRIKVLKNKMNCELMLTYDTPALWQTGSRNVTGPWYGVPIWSLWPNIRFLPSIVAEKNTTKNGHIQNVCSMCIKIHKIGKQEVGIWRVQERYPQYGIPIWCLWPNIRFLPSTVTKKNVTKNILDGRNDGRTDRQIEVKQYTPLPLRGAGV